MASINCKAKCERIDPYEGGGYIALVPVPSDNISGGRIELKATKEALAVCEKGQEYTVTIATISSE